MARGKRTCVYRIHQDEVYDPDSVRQGMRTWAMFLADRMRRRLAERRVGEAAITTEEVSSK